MVKALVTTLPKSGTHLLNVMMHGLGLRRHQVPLGEASIGLLDPNPETAKASVDSISKIVDEMPDNSFVLHHIPYTKLLMHELVQRDVRTVALIRNPFDFVVSLSHHLRANPEGEAPVSASLHGMQHWICYGTAGVDKVAQPPIAKRYFRIMHGWTTDSRALLLRFEEIVGTRGGGLFSDQIASGLALRDFLGVDMSTAAIARVLVGSYRPGIALFRKGKIGSWRDEMLPNTATQMRLLYPTFITAWGYDLEGFLAKHAGDRPNIVAELDAAIAALIEDKVLLSAKLRSVTSAATEANAAPQEQIHADDQAPYSTSTK